MAISTKAISTFANSAATKVGQTVSNFAKKNIKATSKIGDIVEFTGGNYTFATMATMMLSVVLVKRIATALTRNPDDKKATMDEIKEICFRDIQTILIMLFLLNALNAMLAGKQTKKDGLPLINKPFEKVFNSEQKGIKGLAEKGVEFIKNPIEKSWIGIKNVFRALNPLGGVKALTNDEITARYSGFDSVESIKKMFDAIDVNGGDKEKVFSNVIESLRKNIETTQEGFKKAGKYADFSDAQKATQQDLKALEILKEKGTQALEILADKGDNTIDDKSKERISELLIETFNFDKDGKCNFVDTAKQLNAKLRTGALAFEAGYLGFGLPALNKMRLKKEYLDKAPTQVASAPTFTSTPYSGAALINKKISFQEAQLYKNFLR